MSRGHGTLQRRILALLQAAPNLWTDGHALAAQAFRIRPVLKGDTLIISGITDAQLVNLRRALRRLAAEGRVISTFNTLTRRNMWMIRPAIPAVRHRTRPQPAAPEEQRQASKTAVSIRGRRLLDI